MNSINLKNKIYDNIVAGYYGGTIKSFYDDFQYYTILGMTVVRYMDLIKVPYYEFIDMICEG